MMIFPSDLTSISKFFEKTKFSEEETRQLSNSIENKLKKYTKDKGIGAIIEECGNFTFVIDYCRVPRWERYTKPFPVNFKDYVYAQYLPGEWGTITADNPRYFYYCRVKIFDKNEEVREIS